jgi:hypothetical protein
LQKHIIRLCGRGATTRMFPNVKVFWILITFDTRENQIRLEYRLNYQFGKNYSILVQIECAFPFENSHMIFFTNVAILWFLNFIHI